MLQRNVKPPSWARIILPASVIFSRLGVIIPTIGSVIFFNEQPTWLQIAGIIIAVAAIVVYNMPNEKTGQQKLGPVNLLLLLLVFFIGGVGDFDSKIFTMMGNASLGPVFMCYTFIIAFVLSFVLWLVKDHSINLQDVIFGMGLGVFNSIATNLLLASLKTLPAFIAYPFYTVSMLVVVNIVNWLLFREKQGKKKIICLAMTMLLACTILTVKTTPVMAASIGQVKSLKVVNKEYFLYGHEKRRVLL